VGPVTASSWAGIFLDGQATTLFNGISPLGWHPVGAISAGDSVSTHSQFSTAGLGLGDHTLTIVADYWNDQANAPAVGNNNITESSEGNNSSTIHFTVTAPAAPDLLVDSITAPTSVSQGSNFNFSYVIHNNGAGGVAAPFWGGIFLDGQTTTLFNGTLPSGWNPFGPMGGGGFETGGNSFSTVGLDVGQHTLTIQVDYWNDSANGPNVGNNDVAESNETNNTASITFNVTAPAPPQSGVPDVVVDSITPAATSVAQGDTFALSYVIKNIGAGPITASSWAGIYLDGQAATLFDGMSSSGWNHIGTLNAGDAVTLRSKFSTAGLTPGDHTLRIEADYWNDLNNSAHAGNNDILESNETNNAALIHFTVAPHFDLIA
jgi:subtilase family serine protease